MAWRKLERAPSNSPAPRLSGITSKKPPSEAYSEELEAIRLLGASTDPASRAAHDIRNLLAPPLAFLDYLEKLGLDEIRPDNVLRLQAMAKASVCALRRIEKLTEEMMLLSAPGMRKAEEVDACELAREVVSRARLLSDARFPGIDFILTPSAEIPPVLGDECQLNRALTNVVRNAAESMPGGGTVLVNVGNGPDGHVRITVRDGGCGMAQEVLDSIFDPYFSTKGERGTGLGLAITLKIAWDHGGWVEVESEPGNGTEFSIILPVAPSSP